MHLKLFKRSYTRHKTLETAARKSPEKNIVIWPTEEDARTAGRRRAQKEQKPKNGEMNRKSGANTR